MEILLPDEITRHLPAGYQPTLGIWLVLPQSAGARDGIEEVNAWIRAEEWYPKSLDSIIWFGDDGTGNFLGWDARKERAILWNPEDGDTPWREGSVEQIWRFVLSGYEDAAT